MTATLSDRVGRRLGLTSPLVRLPGGNSGLTYSATAGDRRIVVKAVPPGRPAVGRHDMLRQARLLSALADSGVPLPELLAVDPEPPAWFAMSFVDGEAIEPVLDGVPLPPSVTRARMLTAARVLAHLHAYDPAPLAEGARRGTLLTDSVEEGHPINAEPPATPRHELDRWARTMEAVPPELRPYADELHAALAKDVPAPGRLAVVHGDFRLGNVLFVGDDARAVVDWEIWSVGDPRVDLGYFGVFTDHRNFPEFGTPAPGLPDESTIFAEYGVDGDVAWFRALGRYKMAAIMGHNLRRHREGRHDNPVMERLPPTIAALIGGGLGILHTGQE